jgi:tetratricopeptide (TPR) repeat protein
MTVSSNRTSMAAGDTGNRRWPVSIAILAFAATFALATPAFADSGPLILTPWPSDTDPTGAGSGEPAAAGSGTTVWPAPATTEPVPEGERAPEGFTVNALDDVATDYGGTLEPNEGGFGYEMWARTDRALVERLLPILPVRPLSPAMRDLTRRLLLSTAQSPQGTARLNLMTVRADRLRLLGDASDIAAFLDIIPAGSFDAETARLQIDALLLDGRRNDACDAVRNHIVSFDADAYLQKAFAFCQLVSGERISGMLAADLLYEQGIEDAAFYALMSALDGAGDVAIDSLPEPTALHLAMLDAAGLPPPADLVQTSDPLILATLAQNEALDPELRLIAAEQAAARGSYPVVELTKLYRAVEANPEERGRILDDAVGVVTPRMRALLYQSALFATEPATRARYLRRSLDLAREHGGYMLNAAVLLPLITDIVPSPQLTWFAADAGRALYVMRRYEQASAWFAVVRRTEAVDPEAAAAMPTLWLYARVAGGADPMAWDASSLAAWQQAQGDDAAAADHALRLFAVFDGLGESVGNAADMPVTATGSTGEIPNAALFFNLAEAAAGGRRGETVLLALMNLGEGGPGQVNPIVLSRILRSLRDIGLIPEARAIAFEAIVAAGI